MVACSAAGECIPPLILFPGQRVQTSWIPDVEASHPNYPWLFSSKKGWIDSKGQKNLKRHFPQYNLYRFIFYLCKNLRHFISQDKFYLMILFSQSNFINLSVNRKYKSDVFQQANQGLENLMVYYLITWTTLLQHRPQGFFFLSV